MEWTIREEGYHPEKTEFFGSKFCIGNGYFGYRGTLEEYGKQQLAACTVSEIFDDNGSGWREPVNVPNGLYSRVFCQGKELSVLKADIKSHVQELEIDKGLHRRKTVFQTEDGNHITIEAERLAYLEDIHLLVMRCQVSAEQAEMIEAVTEIDSDIWDINGPHFISREDRCDGDISGMLCITGQDKKKIAVAQKVELLSDECMAVSEGTAQRIRPADGKINRLEFVKYIAVCKETDCPDVWEAAVNSCRAAAETGWGGLLKRQEELWTERYRNLGIRIKGDDEAEQAVYYSCYLLYSAAPFHTDRVAIPARGLSGQVYKGAMFWDTEIYMLPMFAFCEPQTAKNLMMYRVHNLPEAKNKAAEYGYRGAFYPWESQENGKDGCTHYNLTDIFTGRKMRTYFRDKQIHISADVVYGLWEYMEATKDYGILLEGAAEVILECARFFYSFAYYKPEKDRYEFLDVTGADEYHERVNNDAYTNYMIRLALRTALKTAEYMEKEYPEQYADIMERLDFREDLKNIRSMYEKIYVPLPGENGVIEQFDGYFKEEDLSIEELYSRIIKPNEYLGSPCGLAVNTQIIKQADVVLLLSILGDQFPRGIKERNWSYYEPRTEHGSSLSTCIYALLAAQIGKTDWAYRFLMKAARIDLDGDYKLYLGDLYIGGTHPAANGGTWMVTVQGFGGLALKEDGVKIEPHLPGQWEELEYAFACAGGRYRVFIQKGKFYVSANPENSAPLHIESWGKVYCCMPGEKIEINRIKEVEEQ